MSTYEVLSLLFDMLTLDLMLFIWLYDHEQQKPT